MNDTHITRDIIFKDAVDDTLVMTIIMTGKFNDIHMLQAYLADVAAQWHSDTNVRVQMNVTQVVK
jgi:hypothetical protein